MKELVNHLENFCRENEPLMILNTSTNEPLLCLAPKFEIEGELVYMQFESLNERGGNSIRVKSIQERINDALYLENEEGNILMIKKLTLNGYKHYIQPVYMNAPDFSDYNELKAFINSLRS